MLVWANNAGKSNIINAIRLFYDQIKFNSDSDFPKHGSTDDESWIEITYLLSTEENIQIKNEYKNENLLLVLRKYLKSEVNKDKIKANQTNMYAVINGVPETSLFYWAKNVWAAKIWNIIYIPALANPEDQMKMSWSSPLRDVINLVVKKKLPKSWAFKNLLDAFSELNIEATKPGWVIDEITAPINKALISWNIDLKLSINSMTPDEITKNLIKPWFKDNSLPESSFDLDRYWHGFQRSVIYELISLAASYKDESDDVSEKKEYNPDFNFLLFEEPEAFLHPAQQESLSYKLRQLGNELSSQVLITSHSPVFIWKVSDDLSKICHVKKENCLSCLYNPQTDDLNKIFKEGDDFRKALQIFIDDGTIAEEKKSEAKRLINTLLTDEEKEQFEKFRYQLWLDWDRASIFFADKILLVEGATERAVINYLISTQWIDLDQYRIFILDTIWKFNIYRYIKLLDIFGLPYWIILDKDEDRNHHKVVNEFVLSCPWKKLLSTPQFFDKDFETFMWIQPLWRPDLKPLHALKSIIDNNIPQTKIDELKKIVCTALNI